MSYDTVTGRWLEPEPFEANYIDGPNLYQAFNSNPLSNVDPSGMAPTQPEAPGGNQQNPGNQKSGFGRLFPLPFSDGGYEYFWFNPDGSGYVYIYPGKCGGDPFSVNFPPPATSKAPGGPGVTQTGPTTRPSTGPTTAPGIPPVIVLKPGTTNTPPRVAPTKTPTPTTNPVGTPDNPAEPTDEDFDGILKNNGTWQYIGPWSGGEYSLYKNKLTGKVVKDGGLVPGD